MQRETKICVHCGCAYTSTIPNQKYCSRNCRYGRTNKPKKYCLHCGVELSGNRWRYCSYDCAMATAHLKYQTSYSSIALATSITGAISELRVAVDLLSKGYEVFRSMSPTSSCDLVILDNKASLKIEVRTAHLLSNGQPSYTRKDSDNADIWAAVLPNEIIYEPPLNKNGN